MNENDKIPDKRVALTKDITLYPMNCDNGARTFTIEEKLGKGGTVLAYKVSFDGADNNSYMYVLKELYPLPSKDEETIRRNGASLDIDEYEKRSPYHSYKKLREQFENAYRIQNTMANGENAVYSMTTSPAIGLYEDRASSTEGNYAVYGLFRYQAGTTLTNYLENSLLELIRIQIKIAEVVKAYLDHDYLWLDIKDSNVNVVGAGSVLSVSMFDFGSLFSKADLMNYSEDSDKELYLSFTPTSSEVLLPQELELIIPPKSYCGFFFVNTKKNMDRINELGKFGEKTCIFLLGSLLFKRLMKKAPTQSDCEELQNRTFDITAGGMLEGYSEHVVCGIKEILKQCLYYDLRDQRYDTVSEYMADLKKLYLELCTAENLNIVVQDARKFVTYCCNKYLINELTNDVNGKFRNLKKLNTRFQSRVSLQSDSSHMLVPPSVAIESAPSLPDRSGNNRLVFLYGDGGMGKSTALYDYMHITSLTAVYIELSRYNDKNSIFRNIFDIICEKFQEAGGFIPANELSRVEDILLRSLKTPENDDPRPQYVLLLDGYNEIHKDYRDLFDTEIKDIIANWRNCRIVITGRNLPDFNDNMNGTDKTFYELFSRFQFVGISEEERISLIENGYNGSVDVGSLQRDKIWDVLRIPMFMGMFLQLNVDTTAKVHTRGEILDQYITKTENDAANQIAGGRTLPNGAADRSADSLRNAACRKFVVCFSLPFAASAMDKDRSFIQLEAAFISQITKGNIAYLVPKAGKYSVYDSYTKSIIEASSIGFSFKEYLIYSNKMSEEQAMKCFIGSDAITTLLIEETGYCYKASNNEIAFTHQYLRDYFAAKHIQNILNAAKALDRSCLSKEEQLQFINDNGLDYTWSDDVCMLLGDIIGDYKNEPGYVEG